MYDLEYFMFFSGKAMSQQDLFAVEGKLRKIHVLSSFLPKLGFWDKIRVF
jgi:hypothetical protein